MTVGELFEADKVTDDILNERDGESQYWSGAVRFIRQNWYMKVESLSEKQFTWMHKILEDMVEYRLEERRYDK